jgi:hypothetical protein
MSARPPSRHRQSHSARVLARVTAVARELARVRLALRLAAPAPAQQPPALGKRLTPDEAATIARASKRQVHR